MIPEFLNKLILNDYNEEILNKITNGYNVKRYVTLRINTLKTTPEDIYSILDNLNIKYQQVSFYKDALIILNKEEKDFIELDIYKEGKIYLQSLSSMIPPLYLDVNHNEQILDMTASPGSKTSEICALSNNTCLITAIEKNKIRFERLKYNLDKLGTKKVNVLNIDSRNIDPYFTFDKILLDAPCSGSGTLNKYNINNISEELISRSIKVQYDLLKEAIKHLKVNGILIYSTCSILKEENENQIIKLLKENNNLQLEPIVIDNNVPTISNDLLGTITVYPTEYYEGFYVARIKRIK